MICPKVRAARRDRRPPRRNGARYESHMPAVPVVSILIPAFRPTWLDDAIQSALAQTFADFELIVSDDSAGDEVERIVKARSDPRIRYLRNPTRGAPGSNRDFLIDRARGEYIKFLFDDDLLYPHSVRLLLSMASRTRCKLAFHSRNVVDANGVVVQQERFEIKPVRRDRLKYLNFKVRKKMERFIRSLNPDYNPRNYYIVDKRFFFDKIIAGVLNRIGEPSNILIHAQTLKNMTEPFTLDGRRMRFLTDIVFYTNFMEHNYGIVGTDNIGSAFRIHPRQYSGQAYPGFSAGIFEWELLGRRAVDAGNLPLDSFKSMRELLSVMYRTHAETFSELSDFLALQADDLAPPLLSEKFYRVLSNSYRAIEKRGQNRKV
jgi:glycosyltransferase involved in cell wall biosynthesis